MSVDVFFYLSYFVPLFYWSSLLLPFAEEFIPLEFVIAMCRTSRTHTLGRPLPQKYTRPDDFISYVWVILF